MKRAKGGGRRRRGKPSHKPGSAIRVRLGKFGLFFNIARYVSGVAWAKTHSQIVMPWWPLTVSRYTAAGGTPVGDTWDQFFERIGHTWSDAARCKQTVSYGSTRKWCPISLKTYQYPAWYEAIKPVNDASYVLGVPHRSPADKQLIDDYVKLRPEIRDRIEAVYQEHLAGRHVIGLHVRGPGRHHDGTLLLNWYCQYDQSPPYDAYAALVEKHLRSDSVILLGTDAGCVQDHFRARWGDQVFCTAPQTAHLGEAHEQADHGGDDPYQLGLHALRDAYLLARADVFVHGHSNMSNYIICMAPDTPGEDVYGPARLVDFSKLPEPADVGIIKEWVSNDPTIAR